MHPHFFEAVAHQGAHRVIGQRLKPFSLWHEVLLDVVDSPFAQKRRAPGYQPPQDRQRKFEALFIATEVCRLLPPNLPEHDSFFARFRRRRAFARFFRRSNKLELIREELKFYAYLTDFRSRPTYGKTKDSEPVNSPPWLYDVRLFKRFNPEYELNDIWALSPGLVAWHNVAAQEAHGGKVKIQSEESLRALERAKAKALRAAQKA